MWVAGGGAARVEGPACEVGRDPPRVSLRAFRAGFGSACPSPVATPGVAALSSNRLSMLHRYFRRLLVDGSLCILRCRGVVSWRRLMAETAAASLGNDVALMCGGGDAVDLIEAGGMADLVDAPGLGMRILMSLSVDGVGEEGSERLSPLQVAAR